MPRRTALIVEVPEVEASVGALRLEHDPSAALGAPAHITILFPFANPVDEDAVAELFARFRPFDFKLDRIEQFEEGAVWLRPAPASPFVDLTAAVMQRWPECPPYEGAFDEVIPHLTVSMTPIDVDIALPIAAHVDAVTLLEEGDDERWSVRRRFPLGQGVP